jgi:hypothetical protein
MDFPGARTLASLTTQELESIHGAPVGPASAWAVLLRGATLMLGHTSPERATSGADERQFTSASGATPSELSWRTSNPALRAASATAPSEAADSSSTRQLMGPPSSSLTNVGSFHTEGHRNGDSLSDEISGVMVLLQNVNAPARSITRCFLMGILVCSFCQLR